MVLIPQGSFLMGAEGFGEFERPVHTVEVSGFWMDEVPVTNAAFARFVHESQYVTEAEGCGCTWGFKDDAFRNVEGLSWRTFGTPDRADHPVVLVTWNDASAYCRWAGVRLPTEAEWEKAARGGSNDNLYSWGQDAPDRGRSNFAKAPSEIPPTTPVRKFAANAYGLYDMVGNVWQWCSDWYSGDTYANARLQDPRGPEQGETRCRRGGSWNVIQPFRLRSANRGAAPPGTAAPNIGFRCVRSAGVEVKLP